MFIEVLKGIRQGWYSQVEGIDFHEIFSLVVKLVSIRTVLGLTSFLDPELE